MSQFLFAPVVQNARSLTRSALPDAPVIMDATAPIASRVEVTGGVLSARALLAAAGRAKNPVYRPAF